MAVKKTDVKVVKPKPDIRQKIIVAEGRAMGTPHIPYKVLYTEFVKNVDEAKKRVAELKEEYKDTDGLSVSYFSV
jgi:hypothetical protein